MTFERHRNTLVLDPAAALRMINILAVSVTWGAETAAHKSVTGYTLYIIENVFSYLRSSVKCKFRRVDAAFLGRKELERVAINLHPSQKGLRSYMPRSSGSHGGCKILLF